MVLSRLWIAQCLLLYPITVVRCGKNHASILQLKVNQIIAAIVITREFLFVTYQFLNTSGNLHSKDSKVSQRSLHDLTDNRWADYWSYAMGLVKLTDTIYSIGLAAELSFRSKVSVDFSQIYDEVSYIQFIL